MNGVQSVNDASISRLRKVANAYTSFDKSLYSLPTHQHLPHIIYLEPCHSEYRTTFVNSPFQLTKHKPTTMPLRLLRKAQTASRRVALTRSPTHSHQTSSHPNKTLKSPLASPTTTAARQPSCPQTPRVLSPHLPPTQPARRSTTAVPPTPAPAAQTLLAFRR